LTRYLFGDSDLAGRRLKILADVYADSTRSFVIESVQKKPRLFLDLGCGPGHTTLMLADALACEQAAGLDNSRHFISLAQKSATDRVFFHLHDVTKIPFPTGPADVLFCRFLMTHLDKPQMVILKWATQLNPRALLLMEETEDILTTNKAFIVYIGMVEALLKAQSRNLYVGPILDKMKMPDSLIKVKSMVKRLAVPTQKAALLFSLNIQTWKKEPIVLENYPSSFVEDLEESLKQMSMKDGAETDIEWNLRQIVLERG
jgi:trans-aconitate 2-methyltransferase